MSKNGFRAWQEYARANDDLRNKLVDEGWFNRPSYDQSFERDVHGQEMKAAGPGYEPQPDPHEGTVWADQEGWNAHYANPNGDTARDAAHEFYGQDHMGHDPQQQADWEAHQAEAHELYGHDPQQPTQDDLYGNPPEPEIEQERE